MPITDRDRRALVSLIESYGDRALRAVGLAHKDIPATEASPRTEALFPEDLEHDMVLDAIIVSFFFARTPSRVQGRALIYLSLNTVRSLFSPL